MLDTTFKVGDRVKLVSYTDQGYRPSPVDYIGKIGTVARKSSYYHVRFDDGVEHLFVAKELALYTPENLDVAGNPINVGDIIVYFTRSGSALSHQKAKVEFIGSKHVGTGRPRILVVREDAEKKNSFTRKAWLWSFNNSVKVG
jgi:hypothetical protein